MLVPIHTALFITQNARASRRRRQRQEEEEEDEERKIKERINIFYSQPIPTPVSERSKATFKQYTKEELLEIDKILQGH